MLYKTAIGNYYFPDDTPECGICETMREGRYFDNHVLKALLPFVRSGSTVIDLGACFGQMTIFFAQKLQEMGGGSVVSVEANRASYNVVVKNVAANNCQNVEAYHRAAWYTSGELLALCQPLGKNKSHGHLSVDGTATEGQSVLSLAIDDLELEDVSAMKIDIQGSDLLAMRGAAKTIKRTGMHIIFEHEIFLDSAFSTSFVDYEAFIREVGYEIKEELPARNFLIGPK